MLKKKGKFYYGDNHNDIRECIAAYSKKNEYIAEHFKDAECSCGNTVFALKLDDEEGAAVRICDKCKKEHPIADSGDYLEDAELDECQCPCEAERFEITAGVSLYEDSEDVKWMYIGCRCVHCGLTAVYGDWKNEYSGYKNLLANV